VKAYLTDLLYSVVKNIDNDISLSSIIIDRPKQIAHGDFSSNVSLLLAKKLQKSPREIAQNIINNIPKSDFINKIDIAGAGFINFFLSPIAHKKIINEILSLKEDYGQNNKGNNKKIQIEFVSANPTGPLHVGHGRGAAIGDSIARLFERSGWKVTREFYYNDAGSQIETLVESIQARCNNISPENDQFPEDGYRGEYIKEIAHDFLTKKTIETLKEKIIPSGNSDDRESIKEYSIGYLRNEQDIDLKSFYIHFDVFSLESKFYKNGKILEIVNILINQKHTYKQDGALWLETTKFGDDKDRVMQKSDGNYTYFIPDVAYHLDKWERGFSRVINEQGADHHSTISRVRAGLQGLNKKIPSDWPEYILHQMITVLKNGKEVKISKRAGSYVTLKDLIDEVGADATRYFLIERRADSQIIFDIDLAKSQNNDNPVYYIQYAHARICGVLKQWEGDTSKLKIKDAGNLNTLQELKLIKKISEFPEIIIQATDELAPHQIANFLKECAAELHSYYNNSKFLVEDSSLMVSRLALIQATKYTLKNGLDLLGISAPNKM